MFVLHLLVLLSQPRSLSDYEVDDTPLIIRSEGHVWEFRHLWVKTHLLNRGLKDDPIEVFYLDCQPVKRIEGYSGKSWEPQGRYFQAVRVPIKSRFDKVVAVRGAFGLGTHWDTMFYGIRGQRLTLIGRSPANNSNGPVNYKGRRDDWLFDDYDRYRTMGGDLSIHLVLLRIGANGRFQKVGQWRSRHDRRLRKTVRTDFLD